MSEYVPENTFPGNASTPACESISTLDESLNTSLDLLKACIHCGMCLPTCPTYRVTGSEAESPRGRLYLMKGLLDERLPDDDRLTPAQVAPHIDQCLGCLACVTACPSGVQYDELLHTTRKHLAANDRRLLSRLQRSLKRWVYQYILPNNSLLRLSGTLLQFYQHSGLQALVRSSRILKIFPGLSEREVLLPDIDRQGDLHPGMSFGNPSGQRVVLLTGCVMDVFYNPIHWATLEVLSANGYYVTIPEQTCCGALAHHGGEDDIAANLAKQNIESIMRHNPDWIVTNSAGCGSTLKHYDALLANDIAFADKAKRFSEHVVDVMELLAKKPLAPMKRAISRSITYHAACHLHHAQKIQQAPMDLLKQIPEITLVPMIEADACCGSAGVYNIEHPEISEDILALKTRRILEIGAQTVVTGNPGCLLQIEHGLKNAPQQVKHSIKVQHPIELLAEAYGKARHAH